MKILIKFKHFKTPAKDLSDAMKFDYSIIDDWIDAQAQVYLDKDYDYLRLEHLITEFNDEIFNQFLDKVGFVPGDDTIYLHGDNQTLNKYLNEIPRLGSEANRDIFKSWMVLADKKTRPLINEFIELFYQDIKEQRVEWANECASDDFDCFFMCIDIDNLEEVSDFFGLDIEIEYALINETKYPISELLFCPHCKGPTPVDHYDEELESFICYGCGTEIEIDKELIEKNKHLPISIFSAHLI